MQFKKGDLLVSRNLLLFVLILGISDGGAISCLQCSLSPKEDKISTKYWTYNGTQLQEWCDTTDVTILTRRE